jgi:high-affinity iron transporter
LDPEQQHVGVAYTRIRGGWLPVTQLGVTLPGWVGTWFALFPTVETIAAQALAGTAVIASYLVAEHVRVRRPKRGWLVPAVRPGVRRR